MKIVSLETSGRAATIATLLAERDGEAILLHEASLSAGRRTARDLAPELKNLLARSGWRSFDVSLVAVSIGPGSFTGLRIGVTTAKTFAYAAGAEVLGVPTLHAVAEQARPTLLAHRSDTATDIIVAAMPAERGQVFSAQFVLSDGETLEPRGQVETTDAKAWFAGLKRDHVATGPALAQLASQVPFGVRVTDSAFWDPHARTVGSLAWEMYRSGDRQDLWDLLPQYHRLSAAEEKWRQK